MAALWLNHTTLVHRDKGRPACPSEYGNPLCYYATILTNRTTRSSSCFRNFPVFSTPGPRRKPGRGSRMFSTTAKSNPHPKIPRPERLDEIYVALKKGIQSVRSVSDQKILHYLFPHRQCAPIGHTRVVFLLRDYLQAHQMDLDNFSRQMKGSKRNSRLVRFHCLVILKYGYVYMYIFSLLLIEQLRLWTSLILSPCQV